MASPPSLSASILRNPMLSLNFPVSNSSRHLRDPRYLTLRHKRAYGRWERIQASGKVHFSNTDDCIKQKALNSFDSSSKLKSSQFSFGKKKIVVVIAAFLLFGHVSLPFSTSCIHPANAVLFSPNTTVPRTGEIALRKAIPANPSMKSMQSSLEEISYFLRIPQRKPYGTMESNVKKALKIAIDDKDLILGSVPTNSNTEGSALYASLIDGKGGLQVLLQSIRDKDPDKVSVALASTLDTIAELELLQAPGLSYLLPEQYSKLPRLTGRGIVELTILKEDGSSFTAEAGGQSRKSAKIQVVLDGYSAPLTTGNFAKMVIDGAYDGTKLNSANQAIISEDGKDDVGYSVPLEIMPSGEFEPLYRTPLSVQDGELPVLPLSVYGAAAMTHSGTSDEFSSPNQFFIYLYDRRNVGYVFLSNEGVLFGVFAVWVRRNML